MRTLNEDSFFNLLLKNNNFNIQIEDRVGLGYKTYGIKNHGEFKDYMNPHDNCLWDAIIPGYNDVLDKNKIYKTRQILGMLWLSDGNHKIAIKIGRNGYDKKKAQKDINTYVTNYLKNYFKRKKSEKNIYGKWVPKGKIIPDGTVV